MVRNRGQAESRWVEAMGVRERIVEERPTYNSETGAYTGTSTYEKPYTEAPGISPLLVAEMLDSTIYFSLKDLGKNLPRRPDKKPYVERCIRTFKHEWLDVRVERKIHVDFVDENRHFLQLYV